MDTLSRILTDTAVITTVRSRREVDFSTIFVDFSIILLNVCGDRFAFQSINIANWRFITIPTFLLSLWYLATAPHNLEAYCDEISGSLRLQEWIFVNASTSCFTMPSRIFCKYVEHITDRRRTITVIFAELDTEPSRSYILF